VLFGIKPRVYFLARGTDAGCRSRASDEAVWRCFSTDNSYMETRTKRGLN